MTSSGSSPRATPSAASTSTSTSDAPPEFQSSAKFSDSICFPQYTASLKCLEMNKDKSNCQQFFDDYKECKKKEREARLERNRKRSLFG